MITIDSNFSLLELFVIRETIFTKRDAKPNMSLINAAREKIIILKIDNINQHKNAIFDILWASDINFFFKWLPLILVICPCKYLKTHDSVIIINIIESGHQCWIIVGACQFDYTLIQYLLIRSVDSAWEERKTVIILILD